ncbi:hypothetical protein N7468_006781 [Penicillium chermesinum]|uniref:Uncharacterized protein n=1 Tax=Penicillium chermesinum TaxID=63820 RepID=A0A9W9NSU9_9EURO|nr:uncharacterized protein N7468_006781 [Penicillium chermesinum]KAJ5225556.1 hypothetical protein N7468_006781 [Penicillium chermesinum]KAJ6161224.1 hypothetical protein N7470_004620 [Penicillium chermesinum]
MSFLSSVFCGCFSRNEDAPPRPFQPEMQESTHTWGQTRAGIQTGRFILSSDGHFVRAAGPSDHDGYGPPPDSDDGGYASVVPLPQYTPRPMSIHEKTLESHMRDPSVSSDSNGFSPDYKNRNLYDEEVISDTASTLSYPSSYGNTSTATRETPPPPYSPRMSAVIARSRSLSNSSARAIIINPPPMALLSGGRITAPPSDADDQSIRRHRRASWESR